MSEYVERRIREIKAARKKKPRTPLTVKPKNRSVPIYISTTGFSLSMDYSPTNKYDVEILKEANRLIERRAK